MAITRINIGPVHPSTHGVLRLVVDLDGDTIVGVEPHIGFLHRGVEKLVENRMYMQNPPYMEKMDYIAPMTMDELYVATVEAATGIEVKERAKYIRTILLEFQRISSHITWLGLFCNDLGQLFTIFMWCFVDRDKILLLLEEATGSRMFYVNMRLGGMNRDLPPDFESKAGEMLNYLDGRVKDYEKFLESNPIFMERTKGIGKISKEEAKSLGVCGPVLRASGIEYDIREAFPYYAYRDLNFRTQFLSDGDSFSRYKVRMMEIRESIRLIRNSLKKIPEGDALGLPVKLITPPIKNSEVLVRRELPRGENMMYMIAEKDKPYRLSIKSASFSNLSALGYMSKGNKLADLFSILGSLDVVMADIDK